MKYTEVHDFEPDIIKYLTNLGGSKQWEYMPDIKTTAQLWDNFRNIIYQLNQDKLTKPLSDNEFMQIKHIINSIETPYQAGKFLYGVNGCSQVEVDLDDGRHVYLTVFDQEQIGAGNTVYQIVNQIVRPARVTGYKERRFDITLLINGLPIIQIEEKTYHHGAREALEQMHQYIHERQYTDIFSTLQILVALTPTEAHYMANTTDDNFNTAFAFEWQDENNKRVFDWQEFANYFLSIPMAHQMATNYMILDGTLNQEAIKVMRPYQVYATKKVINSIRNHDFDYGDNNIGYVWHTTGSGKTITSFKTAWLASRLPNVDKVVFLVDRIALTNQTADEYRAYDPDGNTIDNTASKNDLARKLKTKKNGIIVTSIQKLARLVNSEKFAKINKHIVFIVDEAHRSTAGEMLQQIKKGFPNAAWVGYTGTPVFDAHKGPTTHELFGDVLHIYTIKDAIADRNVLGFKVDFETTLSQDELRDHYLPEYFKRQHSSWTTAQIQKRIAHLTPEDMDDMVNSSVYDMNDDHVRLVVQNIMTNWQKRSVNGEYNAILTTHVGGGQASTPMAMKFYQEFLKQNQNYAKYGLERPLRVAITFSQDTSNSNQQLETNENLHTAIANYNQMFGTSFDDTTTKEYTQQVVDRLSKKISKDPDDYLDLVIVVDQLLTGFNAPQLNTLYVDRTLKGANLIQAYSRTNRIYDMRTKPFGHIINYRWPANSKKLMEDALTLYADHDSASVQTEFNLVDDGVLAKSYQQVVDELKPVVDRLASLTDDFTRTPDNADRQEEMYTLLNHYSSLVSQVMQSDEFNKDDDQAMQKFYDDIAISRDQDNILNNNLADELREKIAERKHIDPIQVNLKMTHIDTIEVNYDYLMELIAQLANQVHDNDLEAAQVTKRDIDQMTSQMDNRERAKDIHNFSNDLMQGNVEINSYPVEAKQINDLIDNHKQSGVRHYIYEFKQKWGIADIADHNLINELVDQHMVGSDDLNINHELDSIIKEAQAVYQTDAATPEIREMNRIKYRIKLRQALNNMADDVKKHF